MMDIQQKKIHLHPHTRIIHSPTHPEQVVLAQLHTGLWVKMPKIQYYFLERCLKHHQQISEIIGEATDPADQDILLDMFHQLRDSQFILFTGEVPTTPPLNSIQLSLTNACNLSCIHCSKSAGEKNENELSLSKLKKLIDLIYHHSVRKITLTGGEPLIRPDFLKILDYLAKYDRELTLMTNGTLIDQQIAPILQKNFSHIHISLDGYNPETTDQIRGTGTFHRVLQGIKNLQRAGQENITLSMVVTKENFHFQDRFVQLCNHLQVKHQFRLFQPLGRGKENSSRLEYHRKQTSSSVSKGKNLERQTVCKNICNAGITTLFINEKGDCYPCSLLDESHYYLGNIFSNPALLENPAKQTIVKELQESIVDSLPECQNCDVRYFCVNGCPAIDRLRYKNPELKAIECQRKRQLYHRIVWE